MQIAWRPSTWMGVKRGAGTAHGAAREDEMTTVSRLLPAWIAVSAIAVLVAACGQGGGGGDRVAAALPGGPSGGGAGPGGTALPQIGGFLHGSYTYLVSPAPTPVTHEVVLTLAEDAAGNVGGQYCLGAVASPGCFAVRGRVRTDGSFQLQLAGPSLPLELNGTAGAITCVDGSAGSVLRGTFRVRESSGIFSFDNCPVAQ